MTKITFHIISIFPEAFNSYLNASILNRAREKKLIDFNLLNLRDFANDKHKKVDDSPYGGGPGMVLKFEPIYKAVEHIKSKLKNQNSSPKVSPPPAKKLKIILFSTRGKKFTQKDSRRLSKYKNIIMICGRYEGVDERVVKNIADEEISIGDFILSGGELPGLVVAEAVSRHIPGVLGKQESLEEVKGSYPVYTRPEIFITKKKKKLKVPEVLLSGDHKKINAWRTELNPENKH